MHILIAIRHFLTWMFQGQLKAQPVQAWAHFLAPKVSVTISRIQNEEQFSYLAPNLMLLQIKLPIICPLKQ